MRLKIFQLPLDLVFMMLLKTKSIIKYEALPSKSLRTYNCNHLEIVKGLSLVFHTLCVCILLANTQCAVFSSIKDTEINLGGRL